MKKMQLLHIFVLFGTTLATNANQFPPYVSTDKLESSYLSSHIEDIFKEPRINNNSDAHYNNYESQKQKPPSTDTREKYIERYVKNHQAINKSPTSVWQNSRVNRPQEDIYKLPQMEPLQKPIGVQNRVFPISSIHFDLVKGTKHKITTEVPIKVEDISFGPSASHIGTEPQRKYMQPHIMSPKRNPDRGTHFYKSVDKLDPKEVIEVTSQKVNVIENTGTTTKQEYISSRTLPPVPTLSPWLDGFGK